MKVLVLSVTSRIGYAALKGGLFGILLLDSVPVPVDHLPASTILAFAVVLATSCLRAFPIISTYGKDTVVAFLGEFRLISLVDRCRSISSDRGGHNSDAVVASLQVVFDVVLGFLLLASFYR
jgi:hypothetical protein